MFRSPNLTKKKVFLLSLHLFPQSIQQTQDSLEELGSLARTLKLEVVGSELQKKNQIHPKTFIGEGKIQECLNLFEELKPELVKQNIKKDPLQIDASKTIHFVADFFQNKGIAKKYLTKNE